MLPKSLREEDNAPHHRRVVLFKVERGQNLVTRVKSLILMQTPLFIEELAKQVVLRLIKLLINAHTELCVVQRSPSEGPAGVQLAPAAY